ncbi:MAG: DsbA family oxidoreductase [Pseudooceanicola sp.]|nr:DsbA family oxidoreductase [Pseudooceanicola sp.]
MTANTVQVDIVSDVVCPWCYVGFRQLEQALGMTGLGAVVRWHPFELNPDMPPEGQNLREHLMQKYGITAEASQTARARLTALGAELGIDFRYSDGMRMVNTFAAHQLLGWAMGEGAQHPLKMALFHAYFTDGRDVSDPGVLVEVAQSVGLDPAAAREVLESGRMAEQTRDHLSTWTQNGITGVPAMIFGGKYLVTGAQGAENYAKVLQRCAAEAA